MATETTRYEIEPIDVRSGSDLTELARMVTAMARERVAEDPALPLDLTIVQMRSTPDAFERFDRVARKGNSVVGRALGWRRLYGTNQHAWNVEIDVLADHRRRGIGRALLRDVVRTIGDDDAAILGLFTTDRIPAGEAFLRATGADDGMTMTTNQLALARVDRALLERWIAAAPSGYRLVWIEGEVPEDLLDNVVAAYGAMATTPTGTLRIWDFTATRDTIRSFEKARRARGRIDRMVLAIDAATGGTAGFTEASWHPDVPHAVQQHGTAVLQAHQGKGIGKWVKAEITRRVLDERPRARYMRTNNNPVNAPIIAINEGLGYRPAWTNTVWQLPLADARRFVGVRIGPPTPPFRLPG